MQTPIAHEFLTAPGANTIGIEIAVGAGAAGYVHFWFNAPFTDAPTFTYDNLDNAGEQGVIAAQLGLINPTASLQALGATFLFDQIQSSDDLIFGSGFESGN